MSSSPYIAILGGGVSGITTGIYLNLLGYRTKLYTERRADVADPLSEPPEFASCKCAASVIPYSVKTDGLAEKLATSQDIFQFLWLNSTTGIRSQRHYEVYEKPVKPPAFADTVRDFKMFPRDGRGVLGVPRRKTAEKIFGFSFECFAAEMPTYITRLYQLYERSGGQVITKRVGPKELSRMRSELIVNCSGFWTTELFEDPKPWVILRGHLVNVRLPGIPLNRHTGECFSYKYVPGAKVYRDTAGRPCDIYCYPRSDAWILGGSRQEGTPKIGGRWTGEETVGSTTKIGRIEVPSPILRLHKQFIRDTTGFDISKFPMKAVIGYRFARDIKGEGLRLDASEHGGRTVIHNYGHGGAGVTLSWGCASGVAKLVRKASFPKMKRKSVLKFDGFDAHLLRGLQHIVSQIG